MSDNFDTEEFLAHYGVKGMKWGVRKDKKPQGYQSNKGAAIYRRINTHDFRVDPTFAVSQINPNKRDLKNKKSVKKTKKELIATSTKVGKTALGSKELWSNIEGLEKKYSDKYGGSSNIDKKVLGKYINDLERVMNQEFSKFNDPNNNVAHKVVISHSDGNISSISYMTGDPSEFSMFEELHHSDERLGVVKRDIKVIYDSKKHIVAFNFDGQTFSSKQKYSSVKHTNRSTPGSDFLAHYGVKGMRWGVRKDRKPQGYQGPKTTKISKEFDFSDGSKTIRLKQNTKKTSPRIRTDISNSDLRKTNERLRLEIEYNRSVAELAKQNRTVSRKVGWAVLNTIGQVGKQTAVNLLSQKMIQVGRNALTRDK